MRIHNSIYSTFKRDKYDSLTDILKSTKNVIQNSNSFNKYLHSYIDSIQVSSFKSPDCNIYPILRSSSIIPLHKTVFDYSEVDKRKTKCKTTRELTSEEDAAKDRLHFTFNLPHMNISIQKNKRNKQKTICKVVKSKSAICILRSNMNRHCRRNCLMEDFLEKWKNNENLQYDESEIFNKSEYYSKIIENKLLEIKFSKIENLTTLLDSKFEDVNGNKIQLSLTSMKLLFTPLNSEGHSVCITLPFAYLFLYYYKDMEFFKNILLSSIKFDNNYENVFFKEDEIYEYLRLVENQKQSSTNMIRKSKTCADESKFIKKSTLSSKHGSETFLINQLLQKKNIVIGNETQNKFIYNTYEFIWITPKKTYKAEFSVPLIIFNFENGRKIVKKYIDREMYLYLWNMNFRNWDYYVVNYLFSFKHFRYIIESLFSKNKTQKIETESIMDQIMNSKRRKKTFDINDEVIFLSSLRSHSSNCKNIATYSFITDEFRNNSIITFYSYIVSVEYNKLNPFKKWTFYLNFKQMKFLIKVSKFERLDSFLVKILKTDFSRGNLELDFSVFDDFDYQILNYARKNIHSGINRKMPRKMSTDLDFLRENNTLSNRENEINIKINSPYIEIQRYMDLKFGITQPIRHSINVELLRSLDKIEFNQWIVQINNHKDSWIFINPTMNENLNQSHISKDFNKKSIQKKMSIFGHASNLKGMTPLSNRNQMYSNFNNNAARRLILNLKK